jgi:hypothetical protein
VSIGVAQTANDDAADAAETDAATVERAGGT